VYGARPLRRLIEHKIQNPIARGILKGEFNPGDRIRVRASRDGELTFTREPEGAPKAVSP
jgi:ATP-dependent Clp protease ATP-binding subunit ClpB